MLLVSKFIMHLVMILTARDIENASPSRYGMFTPTPREHAWTDR